MESKRLILKKWTLEEIKMTYILAGKLNGKCCICVDRVVNSDHTQPTTNKIFHPQSNPVLHLSLTGDGLLMDIIKKYDQTLSTTNKTLKLDSQTINYLGREVENEFKRNYTGNLDKFTCLYAIDGNDVYRYDLEFENSLYKQYNTTQINDGEYFVCMNKHIDSFDKDDIEFVNQYGLEKFSKMRLCLTYKNLHPSISHFTPQQYFHEGFNSCVV